MESGLTTHQLSEALDQQRGSRQGGLRQFKLRGTEKVSAVFGLHVIAYNLIRLGNLLNPTMAAA